VHSGATRAQKIDTLFSSLKWAWCGFHKKCTWKCNFQLAFLHLVGYAGYVVHSGASGV
jgi:hypothetical protein